jgi:hypothetical protein
LPYNFVVLLAVYNADAGGDTPVNVILQAWTRVFTGDYFGAGAIGEQLLQQVQRLTHTTCGYKGAEIAGAIVGYLAGNIHLWKFLCQVNLEIWVALVVFESGIIGRAMFLDEGTFQDEGFSL